MPGQGKKIWGDGLQVSLACPGFHLEAQNFYRSRVGLDAALYAKNAKLRGNECIANWTSSPQGKLAPTTATLIVTLLFAASMWRRPEQVH